MRTSSSVSTAKSGARLPSAKPIAGSRSLAISAKLLSSDPASDNGDSSSEFNLDGFYRLGVAHLDAEAGF